MRPLGWLGIVRLGLVQTALGAVVVLTTSTMNRVMVVEYALPAMLPGALVALHYAVQALRPRFGHGSDGGRRSPWILGGMAVLSVGGVLAALATERMATDVTGGTVFAVVAFVMIGAGVGAAGTSLLALLAVAVTPERRGAAATIVWLMMIAGFAVTAGVAGAFLDPFTPARLVAVTTVVSAAAFVVSALALWRVEGEAPARAAGPRPPFRAALAEVWGDGEARRFAVFVFLSMLAYNMQDLILEPFGGRVFGMTPGETTQLAGMQHGGVLIGMLAVAAVAGRRRTGSLKAWVVGGCAASAVALGGLVAAGLSAGGSMLAPSVVLLGVANGAFAVAAIAMMMALAGAGRRAGAGVRLGVWGAAQAFAFGLGGFLGTALVDLGRPFLADPAHAYAAVFAAEAMLFLLAAWLASAIGTAARPRVFAFAAE